VPLWVQAGHTHNHCSNDIHSTQLGVVPWGWIHGHLLSWGHTNTQNIPAPLCIHPNPLLSTQHALLLVAGLPTEGLPRAGHAVLAAVAPAAMSLLLRASRETSSHTSVAPGERHCQRSSASTGAASAVQACRCAKLSAMRMRHLCCFADRQARTRAEDDKNAPADQQQHMYGAAVIM
jgi:hypothetical protein